MNPVESKISTIIMAGGKGSRLADLGYAQPKCLLSVGNDESLLLRIVNQLQTSDLRDITVCCSPENHEIIEDYLRSHCYSEFDSGEANPIAVASLACQKGPLPALADVLSRIDATYYLLCLADIYFFNNPFTDLKSITYNQYLPDGFLLAGNNVAAPNGSGTGFIYCQGNWVKGLSYRRFENDLDQPQMHLRWSGGFLFKNNLKRDFCSGPDAYGDAPFERWIQDIIEQKVICEYFDIGNFVNVNTLADYEFILQLAKTTKSALS